MQSWWMGICVPAWNALYGFFDPCSTQQIQPFICLFFPTCLCNCQFISNHNVVKLRRSVLCNLLKLRNVVLGLCCTIWVFCSSLLKQHVLLCVSRSMQIHACLHLYLFEYIIYLPTGWQNTTVTSSTLLTKWKIQVCGVFVNMTPPKLVKKTPTCTCKFSDHSQVHFCICWIKLFPSTLLAENVPPSTLLAENVPLEL